MTTTTVFGSTSDGRVTSSNASYATASTGGTLAISTTETLSFIGQGNAFAIFQLFFAFDTSGVPDAETVSSVVFSLDGASDISVTDFDMVALDYDWSAGGLTTANFRTPTQLSALTTLATFPSTSYSAAYMNFTSAGAAFNSYINKTGTTYFMVASSRNISATTPTGDENIRVTMADQTGTTTDPKLVVTSDTAGAGIVGTATITEDADAVGASSAIAISGSLSKTEADDSTLGQSALAIVGTGATTEAPDALAATAKLALAGAAGIAEAADTVTSAGGAPGLTGTLSATEAADSVAASSTLSIAGALAVTEASDSTTGQSALAIVGADASTEGNDGLAAVGVLSITGSLAGAEANDNVASTGAAGAFTSGAAAIAEADDTLVALAEVTGEPDVVPGDVGRVHAVAWPDRKPRQRRRFSPEITEDERARRKRQAEKALDRYFDRIDRALEPSKGKRRKRRAARARAPEAQPPLPIPAAATAEQIEAAQRVLAEAQAAIQEAEYAALIASLQAKLEAEWQARLLADDEEAMMLILQLAA
jgi:hypothetical protein